MYCKEIGENCDQNGWYSNCQHQMKEHLPRPAWLFEALKLASCADGRLPKDCRLKVSTDDEGKIVALLLNCLILAAELWLWCLEKGRARKASFQHHKSCSSIPGCAHVRGMHVEVRLFELSCMKTVFSHGSVGHTMGTTSQW